MPNNTIWKTKIRHVVVLMMENRSFDHLLGDFNRIDPRCEGINRTTQARNTVANYPQPFLQSAQALPALSLIHI